MGLTAEVAVFWYGSMVLIIGAAILFFQSVKNRSTSIQHISWCKDHEDAARTLMRVAETKESEHHLLGELSASLKVVCDIVKQSNDLHGQMEEYARVWKSRLTAMSTVQPPEMKDAPDKLPPPMRGGSSLIPRESTAPSIRKKVEITYTSPPKPKKHKLGVMHYRTYHPSTKKMYPLCGAFLRAGTKKSRTTTSTKDVTCKSCCKNLVILIKNSVVFKNSEAEDDSVEQ